VRRVDLRLAPAALTVWLCALLTGGSTAERLRTVTALAVLALAMLGTLALLARMLGIGRTPEARGEATPRLLAQAFVVVLAAGAVTFVAAVRADHDVLTRLAPVSETSVAGDASVAGGASAVGGADGQVVEVVAVLAGDPVPVRRPWEQAANLGAGVPAGGPPSVEDGWTARIMVRGLVTTAGTVPVGGVLRLRVPHPERVRDLSGAEAAYLAATPAGPPAEANAGATVAPVPRWRSTVQVVGTLRARDQVPRPGQPSTAVDMVLTASRVEVVRGPPWWSGWSDSVRQAARTASTGLSPQGRGLVPGIAIGDTTALPDDLAADMKTSAMTHMTAVSGSHFAILGGLVWALLGLLRFPLRLRAVALVVVTAVLVVLVRPEPSVVRAATMALVGVVAVLVRRPASAVPALATSVVVLVLTDPSIAGEPGFVLSVAATAGLVLLVPVIDARMERWPGWLRAPFVVSLAAQLPCAPVVVLLSSQVSVWAVLANALAALAVAPATVLGLAATLLSLAWPTAGHAVAWLASACTAWIAGLARVSATLPGAGLAWWSGATGVLAMGALCGCVVALLRHGPDLWWWSRRRAPAHLWAARAAVRAVLRDRSGERLGGCHRGVGD